MRKLFIAGLLLFLTSVLFSQNAEISKYEIFEIELKGPETGNPFTDVELSAEFKFKNRTYYCDGFYDGDGNYKIRFMPDEEGEWSYITKSNKNELNAKTGRFKCLPTMVENHGPVQVRDTFHFGYADGVPFYPVGTTCYAWVWQGDELVNQTLETLATTSFNKIRMTVMPKTYSTYINTEPPFYPYEGSKEEGWDFTRFNPEYWRYLEDKIEKLGDLGIEADLILFHPYDYGKWGFDKMSVEENIRYLKYLLARLSAYHNIWWSMANEYDLMGKPEEEWAKYFRIIQTYDPYRHLCSIHNGQKFYNYSLPWITHVSVQTPYLENIQDWRELYLKPVIDDEPVYEGTIPTDWGNLTPEELVNRFWICWTRGAYCTHGETYLNPDNVLWWSKGGKLYGKSPERIAFLHEIMKDAPEKGLYPFHNEWNKQTYLFKTGEYYLHYFGNSQQAAAIINLPASEQFKLDVIDAWEMTITPVDGTFSGRIEIPLPGKPYMAVRATRLIN